MGIRWKNFDREKSFTEQAQPPVPPESVYDLTVTNVTPWVKKGSGCRVTCELTIDNGEHRPFCFDKGFWFPEAGKQDYAIAEMHAMFFAADFEPSIDDGDVTPKQLALAIPINELRFSADCVHNLQIIAWLDRNSYKSVEDDPDRGYRKKSFEKTEECSNKKYLNVERKAFDAWKKAGGDTFVQMEIRRGSYVEMGLIYQPAKNSSERKVSSTPAMAGNGGMANSEFEGGDRLPF